MSNNITVNGAGSTSQAYTYGASVQNGADGSISFSTALEEATQREEGEAQESGQSSVPAGLVSNTPTVQQAAATTTNSTASLLLSMMMGGMGDDMTGMLMTILLTQLFDGNSLSNLFGTNSVQQASLPQSSGGSEVLDLAFTRVGDPYSQPLAGQDDYVDCSYLAMWCYRQVGVNLPRTAAEQAKYCVDNNLTISKEELQPGDLVFFSHRENGRYMDVTHVAVYAGDGKIVDASSSRGEVVYRDMLGDQVLYGRPGAYRQA